jgi:hypothetical protein
MASAEIHAVRTVSGNQPVMSRLLEKLTQTFKSGVPVQVDTTVGAAIEWDGATVALGIAGFAREAASNLVTTGVPKTLTFGSVQNQASAVNIPRGAPINDGKIGVEIAAQDTVWYGQVGPAQTTAVTDVGKQYGMTKDADGHWYVDKTKTTVGTNTVVTIVAIDGNLDTTRGVFFTISPASAQLVA